MQSSSPALFKAVVVPSALGTALLAVIFPAYALDAATDLDQVVVTGSRTAQTQNQTLAAITVIDRTDIERLQPSSLPELLRGSPGVSLANNGGPGKSTSLFLRGTESDHVLVLVDGIKIGSATSGGAALQDIPVEQIERIEIVRGPFSSLYGSEALGGVIQIFTRRPQTAFAPNFSIGVGSFDTLRLSAGVGGRGERGWYSINAAHEDTDGIDAFRGNPALARPERYRDPDLDGYRNQSLSLQGGYRFNDAWDADARVLRAEGRNEYDGSRNNQADSVQQVVGARVRFVPNDRLALTANAGHSADLSDAFLNGVYSSTFDTRRRQGSLQADLGVGANLLSVGLDWQRDEVDSSTAYAVDHRSNRGLFGQWQSDFGAHALQASVRRDDNSQFGGKTTGSALWGWDVSDAFRLTASAGTAFKAPTFNELYFPGYGNPLLQPETSRSIELGARGRHGWGGWSLNGFSTRIDDLIAYDATLGEFGGPNNIDRAHIRGVEATADTELAGWILQGSASWLDPRNDAGGRSQGNVLPRRARRTARIDGDRRFGAIGVGASVIASGERFDDLANRRRMGGYATTDLRISYAMTDAWSVRLTANNVFDKHYETAAFYRQPGRNYLLTVRYSPAR
jgi:vitamin B12 transporter